MLWPTHSFGFGLVSLAGVVCQVLVHPLRGAPSGHHAWLAFSRHCHSSRVGAAPMGAAWGVFGEAWRHAALSLWEGAALPLAHPLALLVGSVERLGAHCFAALCVPLSSDSGCVCGLVAGRLGVLRRSNLVLCLVMAKPLRVTPAFDWAVRGSLDGTLRPLGVRSRAMQWLRTSSWMASSWLPFGAALRLCYSLTALCRLLGVMVCSDG